MSNCIITTAVNMYNYAAAAVVVGQLQSVEEQGPCLYVTQFNSSSSSFGAFSPLHNATTWSGGARGDRLREAGSHDFNECKINFTRQPDLNVVEICVTLNCHMIYRSFNLVGPRILGAHPLASERGSEGRSFGS